MSFLVCRAVVRPCSGTLKPQTSLTSTINIMQARSQSRYSVPPGAWDAHMHVTDLAKFPSKKKANSQYQAHSSTIEGARANASRIGVPNLAFVQVSTYGQDNSCLLWCLGQTGRSSGRGVVDFDPATTDEQTLRGWHAAGVCGVRVNYKSVGAAPSAEAMRSTLEALDAAVAPLGSWGIHIHAASESMPALGEIVPSLRAKVCIDHMGCPPKDFDPEELVDSPGWHALLDMCGRENVFVKVSAPYRSLQPAQWERFERPVKQLLACRGGDAVVFASDWPHTRFEDTEIHPWVEYCLEWCGEDDALRTKLFRGNSEVLYDVR